MKTHLTTLGLALLLTGCNSSELIRTDSESKKAFRTSTSKNTSEQISSNIWPKRIPTPELQPEIEKKVSEILGRMSSAEKVGQIIQPEIKYVTPEDVKEFHLGSVLNGGGTTPYNKKYASVSDWVELAEAFYQASMDESDGKVGIPLLWGSDAVHGNNNLFGATLFPHNIGLGAANDPELIEKIGEITALELAVTGLDWTFAPTVAVARDDRWGRTYESYSESPEIVSAYAARMIQGIQGSARKGQFQPGKTIATAKHFIGDGGTTNGIDRGDTAIDENQLLSIHGSVYISALDSNVLTTMASFNSWNGDKLHGHKYLLTDILKGRLGFNGFVVGDWNGHSQIPGCTITHCPTAINAGLDMFMVPEHWRELYQNTLKDIETGEIPISRLDDAVKRILRVKMQAGLFSAGSIKQRLQTKKANVVGSPEHRAVAREAVRKSLVLLKNNNGTLPIKAKQNVLVSGTAANDIGQQSGGWTLSWQGTGNSNKDFPGATSIYDGLAKAIHANGGQAILSTNGSWQNTDFKNNKSPDLAVVVIGETPYAEWHGDVATIEYNSKVDLDLLQKLKAQGIPVVTVFISGRPLWVNKELNASDAFVAAWLPGSEGVGIADVLVAETNGRPAYDFQGKLSFSWPKRVSQNRLNRGQKNYDPLFPYGYGLNYANPAELSNDLDETSRRNALDPIADVWVFVDRDINPWQLELRPNAAPTITVNGNTAETENGSLLITSIDQKAQEDARRLKWKGAGSIAFTAPTPIDLGDLGNAEGALQFEVKLNKLTLDDLTLGMTCENGCNNEVSLSQLADSQNPQNWNKVHIELSCFSHESKYLNKVRDAFVLKASTQVDLSIANIKVVKETNTSNSLRLECK